MPCRNSPAAILGATPTMGSSKTEQPVSIKANKSVINNLPQKKTPDPHGFPDEFDQIFK